MIPTAAGHPIAGEFEGGLTIEACPAEEEALQRWGVAELARWATGPGDSGDRSAGGKYDTCSTVRP
jgi:hypothetical protein